MASTRVNVAALDAMTTSVPMAVTPAAVTPKALAYTGFNAHVVLLFGALFITGGGLLVVRRSGLAPI